MAEQNPETEAFKNCKEFEKIIFIDAENIIEDVKEMIKNANGLIAKITQIFVLKTSQEFKTFFGINGEDNSAPDLREANKSGSLLRQTASSLKKY